MTTEQKPFDPVLELKKYNQWRRGWGSQPMPAPGLIGDAIDAAIAEIKRLREVEKAALAVMEASDVRLISALRHLFRVIRLQGKA